jgi:hypothetical protein
MALGEAAVGGLENLSLNSKEEEDYLSVARRREACPKTIVDDTQTLFRSQVLFNRYLSITPIRGDQTLALAMSNVI